MIRIDYEKLKTYAYVNISTYRVKTVKSLANEVKTSTQIANNAKSEQTIYQRYLKS